MMTSIVIVINLTLIVIPLVAMDDAPITKDKIKEVNWSKLLIG